ncbi:WSC domain-containing protein [Hirsutella rhossiliensis]|uniref:WSC domain-containing protein n=1 Tax=Hirsutella rhossiliensis TaxID=111463 RepID=A0A9P8SJF9_9HYPO|nr:WSC domain-containing protein [Hirsutella rhossiliensis]KAH0963006.1 WSC domain-containing protein [Hirsutella rhossiliensis]
MKPAVAAAFAALMGATAAKDERTFAVLRFNNKQLTKGRMDPIRNPGVTSAHVHNILGGSGFSTSAKGPDLQKAKCTTAKVKGDNSNYWFPSLYFRDPKTGKFEDVELFYANAYYFFEATNDDIKAFPLGLSIISGDPDMRSPPAAGAVTNLDPSKGPVNPIKWTCPRDGNRYDPPSWPADSDGTLAGIGDPVNKGEGVGFPDVNCDGFASPLRADIHFPSCYNPDAGLTDYKSNAVFPTESAGGKQDCPKGHVHVPHLFLEIYWNTPAFKDRWEQGKDKQPFILSNGDSTGFSLHADFMAGWDEKVLQRIIDTCNAGTAGMDKCPDLPLGLNEGDCTIESSVNEKVDGVLDSLPGNNRVSGWAYGGSNSSSPSAGEKPALTPSASRPDASGQPTNGKVSPIKRVQDNSQINSPVIKKPAEPSTESSTHNTNPGPTADPEKEAPVPSESAEASSHSAPGTPSQPTDAAESSDCAHRTVTVTRQMPAAPTKPASNSTWSVGGFKYAGCFKDASERALGGVIRADLGSMSNGKCISHCKAAGYALAGTEYGGQCYCGNELVGSQHLDDGKCEMPCEGDASQVCGGGWALSVYSKDGHAALKGTKSRRHFHHHVRRHRSYHS